MELRSIDGIKMSEWNLTCLILLSKIGERKLIVSVLPKGTDKPITKTINLTG